LALIYNCRNFIKTHRVFKESSGETLGETTMHWLNTNCLFIALCLLTTMIGCSPEVGSEEWCQDMKQKPKSDWTASEVASYANHYIIE
jgi:hypothetical protein